jgi:hypothetical protein
MKRIVADYHGFSLTGYLFICLSVYLFICRPVCSQNTTVLPYAWSGGLNSCQFCSIDINLDGTSDLLVFDRHGNRILPYIRTGWGLVPAPQYAGNFPDLHDWVTGADYNCDGKTDLFTYSLGGARVFENVSDTALKFRLVTNLLKSYYYSGYVGILMTPVDYPAIADIDGDGDLDLLTFFGLGSYVEYHRNMSMEKFGTCDSLDYNLADHCWGNFKESEGGNRITLGVTCPYKYSNLLTCAGSGGDDAPKHTGSTLLATDLNGDGLQDLLLGDIDFPNLAALVNGGTPDSANMISLDTLFPAGSVAVRLFSFPASSLIDVDGDGVKDLLVSPFDPNLTVSENRKSIWYYKNTGTSEVPAFQFATDRLFQQDMLDFGSASYPVLFDLNGDGLQDLLVGSYGGYDSSWYAEGVLHSSYTGRISYFRNTGTMFDFVTADLGAVSSLSLQGVYPAFGDVNGDGFPDMIAGSSDGKLIFFQNDGTNPDTPTFMSPIMKYQDIDVGDFSAPQLFDLDKDGLPDLIIGEKAGNLNWYRNTGTATNPVFTLVTDSLGRINVTNPALSYDGYSTPCFFRTQDQSTLLLVGSEEGKIIYYKDIDNNLGGAFTLSDSLFETTGIPSVMPAIGWRSAPAVGHVTDINLTDVIAGNYSGGLNYFSAHVSPQVVPGLQEPEKEFSDLFSVFPNPVNNRMQVKPEGEAKHLNYTLEIFSLGGKTIFKANLRGDAEISTVSWANGCYFARMTDSTGRSSCKGVIVIH